MDKRVFSKVVQAPNPVPYYVEASREATYIDDMWIIKLGKLSDRYFFGGFPGWVRSMPCWWW